MNQLTTFINMSGYGQYIWPAYAISAIVLAGIIWQSYRFLKRTESELDALRDLENNSDMTEYTVHEAQE